MHAGDSDAHSIGVSAEPECYCHYISEDCHVVMCSDGVWDVLDEQQVAQIIAPCGNDVNMAAKKV